MLGTSRLLTITGTGGVGKTRLAVELVREVARTFDELWLVELGTLAPSESVPDAIASAIGFHSLGSDITAELGEFIAERKALLILDGCEHVLEQCATFVVTLLRLCPALRILATSRAPLRLTHEAVLLVGTLPTPRKRNRHTSLTTSPAVRLFLDRAARAHDGIDYHQDDLLAIADICRQLDGLPLAIELAAARV
ncbi:NB-ARC domain-containing protein, partial [Paenibacillus sp. TAF58]